MCYAAIPMLIMAIGSMATSVMANQKQNEVAESQAEASNKATGFEYATAAMQQGEIDEKRSHEMFQRRLQTERERAMLKVAQGEAGVGGNSSVVALNNVLLQGKMDERRIQVGGASEIGAVRNKMFGADLTNQGRIMNATLEAGDPMNNMITAGLNAAGAGASGYSMGTSMKLKGI